MPAATAQAADSVSHQLSDSTYAVRVCLSQQLLAELLHGFGDVVASEFVGLPWVELFQQAREIVPGKA